MNTEIKKNRTVLTIGMTEAEFNLVQVALWTLKSQINQDMSTATDVEEIARLHAYAVEIIDLKHDLVEARTAYAQASMVIA